MRTASKKSTQLFAAGIALAFAMGGTAESKGSKAQSLCVNPAGTGGCSNNIRDAVGLITTGDATITVNPGTYSEGRIELGGSSVGPRRVIAITGAGVSSTIVMGDFTVGAKTNLTLSEMTIAGETGAGNGVYSYGARLTITDCLITDHLVTGPSFGGAGIYVKGGSLTLSDSTVSGNSINSIGGGIALIAGASPAKAVIENSTISSNSASGFGGAGSNSGGGIFLNGAHLTLTDSTISGNIGGAIQAGPGDKVTLNNVTIANNSANTGSGGIGNIGAKIKANNTVIAGNSAINGDNDCSGTIISKGYNLILDTTGCTITGKTSTDIIEDPLLGPLANNGGSTETQSLSTGSPALGAGNPAKPNGKGSHCLATDQVGNARTKGECDIGALQVSGVL